MMDTATPEPHPAMARALLTREQVAVMLRGRDSAPATARQWLAENRAALEALGFPPAVPGTNRYDPAAILAWLDSQVPAHLRPFLAAAHGPGVVNLDASDLDDWETQLDAAARDLAAAE